MLGGKKVKKLGIKPKEENTIRNQDYLKVISLTNHFKHIKKPIPSQII